MVSVVCPNCNHKNKSGSRFCNNCASPLTTRCPVCGHENPPNAKFCSNCANEISTGTHGLVIKRAKAWQKQFSAMGWFESLPPEEIFLFETLEPQRDEDSEPLVFVTSVSGEDWKFSKVNVNNKPILRTGLFSPIGYLIATRWRFVLMDSNKSRLLIWPYSEIAEVNWESSGSISLEMQNGDSVEWQINVKGPGLFDAVVLIGAQDHAKHGIYEIIQEKAQTKRRFMDVVGDFLSEIANTTE